jgi:hypothetical protein
MVKLLKFFAFATFFVLALIYFVPKQSAYYAAEKEARKYKVVLSGEEIVENAFSLELNHSSFSYSSIESATIGSLNVKLFGLYNAISASDIRLSSVAKAFVPLRIDEMKVTYGVFDPLNALFSARGEFGALEGKFNLKDRNVSVILKPSPLMSSKYQNTMREFKKNEKGEYEYDKIF